MSASAFVGYYGRGTRLRLNGPAGKVASRRARREAELKHAERAAKAAAYAERKAEAEQRALEYKAANSGVRGFVGKVKKAVGRLFGRRGQ